RGAAANDVDLVLGVEVVGAKRNPFLGRVAREVVLGEVGPVVRRSVVLVDDGEPSVVARAAKHLGGRGAGGAAADDDDGSRSGRPVAGDGIGGAEGVALALSRDEDFLVAPFHGPARNGRQRRRAKRFARAQVEAGVVPGTAHLVAVDESLGERAAVVGAGRADREEIVAAADEEHGLAVRVTEQGLPVAHGARVHSGAKVRSDELRLFRHGRLLRAYFSSIGRPSWLTSKSCMSFACSSSCARMRSSITRVVGSRSPKCRTISRYVSMATRSATRSSLIMSTRSLPSTYSEAAREPTPSGFRFGLPPS